MLRLCMLQPNDTNFVNLHQFKSMIFFLPRYQSLLILNLKVMIAQRDVFGFCRIKAKPVIMNVKSLLTFYHPTSSKIKKRDCYSLYANEPC